MKTKMIIRLTSLCLLILAIFACASGGGGSGSSAREQAGERGLAVEELPNNKAEVEEVFPQFIPGLVHCITFSPDGKIIATGSETDVRL